MVHRQETALLNKDLDDLSSTNPSKYNQLERKLKLLRIESDLAVTQSAIPAGTKSMERLH